MRACLRVQSWFLSCLIVSSIASSFVNLPAFAAEIKILDEKGLTRAYKKTTSPVRVQIFVEPKSTAAKGAILSNLDGMAPDMEADSLDSASGALLFKNIREGSWQFRGAKDAVVTKVDILGD